MVIIPARPGVFDVNAVQETIQTCRAARKPYAVVINGAPARRDEVESRIVTIAREALAKFRAPVWSGQITNRADLLMALAQGEGARNIPPKAGRPPRSLGCGRRSSARSRRSAVRPPATARCTSRRPEPPRPARGLPRVAASRDPTHSPSRRNDLRHRFGLGRSGFWRLTDAIFHRAACAQKKPGSHEPGLRYWPREADTITFQEGLLNVRATGGGGQCAARPSA